MQLNLIRFYYMKWLGKWTTNTDKGYEKKKQGIAKVFKSHLYHMFGLGVHL